MKNNLTILLIYILYLSVYSKVMASEEIRYDLIKKNDIYEIRKYYDSLVVQTIEKDGNKSFRKLFGYISGKNDINQKIKMTTPVLLIKEKDKIKMQFFLPSNFNKNNVPNPTRSDLEILSIKGGFYAVIKYSGRSSDKNFIKYSEILKEKLLEDNVKFKGLPIKATYNGPFTPPPFRKNEAMYLVELN